MSNILKDAMIDAKAVRATALANARAAMQEAFSPKLEAMFSQKLKELDQDPSDQGFEDASGLDDASSEVPSIDTISASPSSIAAPVSNGLPPASEPIASPQVGLGAPVPPEQEFPTEQPISESEDYSLKGAPKGEKTVDSIGVNGQTTKAQKKDDKNETAPLSGKGGSEPKSEPAGEKTTDSVGVNGQTKQAQKKDDKNITTPLKEEEDEDDKKDKSELDEILAELEGGDEKEEDEKDLKESDDSDEEEIDLDEVLSSLAESSEEDKEKSEDKEDDEKDELKEQVSSLLKENTDYKRALSYLKTKLNEINLLNAKLLYTNKLFKAADLSNSHKIKIVESMDLAKSVREVKYAYSILAESLNFGGKQLVKESAAPVRKVVETKKAVNTITEGFASKTVDSTKPKATLLTEGTEMASRFQKLAGIKRKA